MIVFQFRIRLQVWGVFHDICQMWQVFSKCPRLKRSTSEVQSSVESMISPSDSTISSIFDNVVRVEKRRSFLIGNWSERSPDEFIADKNTDSFRARASTDGTIPSRPRSHYPLRAVPNPVNFDRRMSISQQGAKNASY